MTHYLRSDNGIGWGPSLYTYRRNYFLAAVKTALEDVEDPVIAADLEDPTDPAGREMVILRIRFLIALVLFHSSMPPRSHCNSSLMLFRSTETDRL